MGVVAPSFLEFLKLVHCPRMLGHFRLLDVAHSRNILLFFLRFTLRSYGTRLFLKKGCSFVRGSQNWGLFS